MSAKSIKVVPNQYLYSRCFNYCERGHNHHQDRFYTILICIVKASFHVTLYIILQLKLLNYLTIKIVQYKRVKLIILKSQLQPGVSLEFNLSTGVLIMNLTIAESVICIK